MPSHVQSDPRHFCPHCGSQLLISASEDYYRRLRVVRLVHPSTQATYVAVPTKPSLSFDDVFYAGPMPHQTIPGVPAQVMEFQVHADPLELGHAEGEAYMRMRIKHAANALCEETHNPALPTVQMPWGQATTESGPSWTAYKAAPKPKPKPVAKPPAVPITKPAVRRLILT